MITDAYLRFYFRFLKPYLAEIGRGRVRQAVGLLYDRLLDFIGTHTFEELCRTWIGDVAELGELPFLPERTGSFWARQAQVDVVAINWRIKDILLGACKWGQKPVGRDVIETLISKTGKVLPGNTAWKVHYVFFARLGFTEAARSLAAAHNGRLVTLAQVEADMRRYLQAARYG